MSSIGYCRRITAGRQTAILKGLTVLRPPPRGASVSLKPSPVPDVPELTARAAFPKGNPYLRLRDAPSAHGPVEGLGHAQGRLQRRGDHGAGSPQPERPILPRSQIWAADGESIVSSPPDIPPGNIAASRSVSGVSARDTSPKMPSISNLSEYTEDSRIGPRSSGSPALVRAGLEQPLRRPWLLNRS